MSVAATTSNPLAKIPMYLNAIRVWESLYALPFAYMGMVLAAEGWPAWSTFIWITVAMAGARTLAMSANRLIHRKEDAANPRTANRHLPRGLLSAAGSHCDDGRVCGRLLLRRVPVEHLDPGARPGGSGLRNPLLLRQVLHLGAATCFWVGGWPSLPQGAWIAVTGTLEPEAVLLSFAVATWAGGFDILYSCALTMDFDREYGVNSIPRRFGIKAAFNITRGLHLLSAISLAGSRVLVGA